MSTSGEKSSERSSRQRGSSECKPLIDAATKDLFRKNAFRITGLSVDATAREITKHADKIKMFAELGQDAHTGAAFRIKPPPTLDEIREAVNNLKDPEKRLIDEFFWFWPEEFGNSESDPAMQALAKGDSKTAIEIWNNKDKSSTDGVVAAHNLALVYHLTALDLERLSFENEVSEEWRQKIVNSWKKAFERWENLATNERLWEKVTARIRQLNEPNLPTGFARRMRATLPEALDKINAELAVAFAESGKIELARLHIRFMRETNQGLDNFEKTAELVLTPARNRLKEQIRRAKERADKNPRDAVDAARELLKQARQTLDLFDLFLGVESDVRNDLFDELAAVCNRLQFVYYKATSDDKTCLEILKVILPFATSIDLRQLIEKDISETCTRLVNEKLKPVYTLLSSIQDSKDDPITRLGRFNAEVANVLISAMAGLSRGSDEYNQLWDSAAIVLRGISLEAWNKHEDMQTAVAANELAVKHATSPELKQRLVEDKATLQQMGAQASAAAATQPEKSNNTGVGCLVVVAIFIVLGVIGSCNSTNNSSSSTSYTPPAPTAQPRSPAETKGFDWSQYELVPSSPRKRANSTYQIPANLNAELDTESRAIETEKAKAERIGSQLTNAKQAVEAQKAEADELNSQLETLGRQIERDRIYLDQENQSAVDDFNRKVNRYNTALRNVRTENELVNQMVNSYNALLEQLRTQNRTVNQMVDSYNAKLQRYGR